MNWAEKNNEFHRQTIASTLKRNFKSEEEFTREELDKIRIELEEDVKATDLENFEDIYQRAIQRKHEKNLRR